MQNPNYPTFDFNGQTLLILPGIKFSKKELVDRLTRMRINTNNSTDKNYLSQLYDSNILNDNLKLSILGKLQKDTENMGARLGISQRQSLPVNYPTNFSRISNNNQGKAINISVDEPIQIKEQQINIVKPIHTNKGQLTHNPFISMGNNNNNTSEKVYVNNISNNTINPYGSKQNKNYDTEVNQQKFNNNNLNANKAYYTNNPDTNINNNINTETFNYNPYKLNYDNINYINDNSNNQFKQQNNFNNNNSNRNSINMYESSNNNSKNDSDNKKDKNVITTTILPDYRQPIYANNPRVIENNINMNNNFNREADEESNFSFFSAFRPFKETTLYKNRKQLYNSLLYLIIIVFLIYGIYYFCRSDFSITDFFSDATSYITSMVTGAIQYFYITIPLILLIILSYIFIKHQLFKKKCKEVIKKIIRDLENSRRNERGVASMSEDDIYRRYFQDKGVSYKEFVKKYLPQLKKLRRNELRLKLSSYVENNKNVIYWEYQN